MPVHSALPTSVTPSARAFDALRLRVLQRDWLSSNNIVFLDPEAATGPGAQGHRGGAAVVDTGYAIHAPQTVALIEGVLGSVPLTRILNTHLHSDHCGGNRALQTRWPQVQTAVPALAFAKAQAWDEAQLTYRLTGQTCEPFQVDAALVPGSTVQLGGHAWQVHGTAGHDPDAVVLFEPHHRVLISGDALWRSKVAVIFPELDGEDGFEPALASLDLIEALAPAVVIPGHGEPFTEVDDALRISRQRLHHLKAQPAAHVRHALRVLMVFHLMEHRRRPPQAVCEWMASSPMAHRDAVRRLMQTDPLALAHATLKSLLDDGVLVRDGDAVALA